MISNKIKISLFIGVPIFIIILIIIANWSQNKTYKGECTSNADCQGNETCQFNIDYNKKLCSSGHTCFITPDSSLLECDASDIDNSCNVCNNQPAYKCVVVNNDHPYKIKVDDNTFISLKNSNPGKGWCLPPLQTSSKCSPLTSDTVLTETGHDVYNWSCLCKYPELVTKSTDSGDCDQQVACGYESTGVDLYVPDGSSTTCSNSIPCNSTASEPKICYRESCYKKWSVDKDTDPTTGICNCLNGTTYIGTTTNKFCISDNCSPHGKTDSTDPEGKKCVCDTGYIECPGEYIKDTILNQKCTTIGHSTCIKDPCGNGQANKDYGCACDDGYVREYDEDSPTLYTCKLECNNPNFCGDRGTCSVVGTGYDKYEECQCICPWTYSDDKRCTNNSGKIATGDQCNANYDPNQNCKDCCNGTYSGDTWYAVCT